MVGDEAVNHDMMHTYQKQWDRSADAFRDIVEKVQDFPILKNADIHFSNDPGVVSPRYETVCYLATHLSQAEIAMSTRPALITTHATNSHIRRLYEGGMCYNSIAMVEEKTSTMSPPPPCFMHVGRELLILTGMYSSVPDLVDLGHKISDSCERIG